MAAIDLIHARRRKAMLAAGKRWQKRTAEREAAMMAGAAFGATGGDLRRGARFDVRRAAFAEAADLQRRGQLPVFVERKIGPVLNFMSGAPSEAARKAGRPVARIVNTTDPQIQPTGFATGFLVHPGLLLTNCHVFPDPASVKGTGANFGYEQGDRGLQTGMTFALDPDTFFAADDALDFALVGIAATAVTGEPLSDWGMLVPSGDPAKILVGQPISIIQYPDGGPKEYATADNRLVDILDDGFLQYTTDTLEGSSGAPAFSEAWELVALHHAGVPEIRDGKIIATDDQPWTEEMGDDKVKWVANEGVRISAIMQSLARLQLADAAMTATLRQFLVAASDPADDILKVIADTPRVPESTRQSAPLTMSFPANRKAGGMGDGISMTFMGPVTINIYSGGTQAADAFAATGMVAEEKSLRFDTDYADRKGYDAGFLGSGLEVPFPGVIGERSPEMYRENGEVLVLPYHHYSLAMNQARRLTMWTAANVDYAPESRATGGRTTFGSDRWIADPRIPREIQTLESDIYGPAHQIDLGHVVRRQDSAWGDTIDEIEFANSDTFHLTNCTPQHEAFNRASPSSKKYGKRDGLWGGFETYTQQQLLAGDTRACLLAGPILDASDPEFDFGHGKVKLPIDFWKVVVVADTAGQPGLRAFGFILSQRDLVEDFGVEFAPGRFARFLRPLAEITARTGVTFAQPLLDADQSAGFADVAGNPAG